MKINDVRAYYLRTPLKKPWRISGLTMTEMTALIVEVETDNGLIGYGEALTRLGPLATKAIIDDILRPVLLGADPIEVDVLWEKMFATMMSRGHWKGFMIEAISGVDIALWDIKGKALNQPVHKLMGGCHHPKFEAYASSIMIMDKEEMVKEAEELVRKGFNKIKLKIGQDVEKDFEYIKAARQVLGPQIGIMIDANSGYTFEAAKRLGNMLASLNILWFEEPVPSYDYEAYARLNDCLPMPVVAGESEFTRWGFRDLIVRGNVPVIQPDVARCGGLTEAMKIAALASAHGVSVAPHTGASGAVSIAASMQFAAYLSNFYLFEYMYPENPLRENILKNDIFKCENGYLTIPDGPGLGIDMDLHKLEQYKFS
jgi:L-alanine-DL-glutamate epimerase-like enolase superfamily enzyme